MSTAAAAPLLRSAPVNAAKSEENHNCTTDHIKLPQIISQKDPASVKNGNATTGVLNHSLSSVDEHSSVKDLSASFDGATLNNNRLEADQPIILPLVEEYRFVPYIEQSASAFTESLQQYTSDCFNYTLKSLEEWVMKDEHNYVPNKEILIDVLARQRSRRSGDLVSIHNGPDCGLAKAIQSLFSLRLSQDMNVKVYELLNGCRDIFYSDKLLSSLHSVDILKPCLDIVAENIVADNFTVLEVGAAQNAMYRHVMSVAALAFPKPIIYNVADTGSAADFPKSVSLIKHDPGAAVSTPQDQSMDLLILNHVLHKQDDIAKTLDRYSTLVRPGGFLLVKEVTGNFPLCLVFEALSERTEYPRTRGDRIFGRYQDGSSWSKLFSKRGFEVIYERSDGVFATLYLLRKRQSATTLSSPIVFHMDDLHFSWLEDLVAKVGKIENAPDSARLWLVSKKETNGLVGFLKCLRHEAGGDKVRGILTIDLKQPSHAPRISASSPDFQSIAQRDLVQNVFRDGVWGSFRHIPIHTGSSSGQNHSRTSCKPEKCYIVVTGADHHQGLLLIQWLVDRGATKILLCSRCSATVIQKTKTAEHWKNTGVQVNVSSCDVTTVDGAWGLVNQAHKLGPLGGVFNLNSTTHYGLFRQQTRESFQEVFDPKVQSTVNLDHVTRALCLDNLDWFVIFSSATCGRGQRGHTNFGFCNSVIERICEKRQADKLPALAIQWGPIADESGKENKGVVSDKNHQRNKCPEGLPGLVPQTFPGCLTTLDVLLSQHCSPVMSSVVVAQQN